MARTTTTAQADALAALDRRTFVRVMVEDPDGTMVDVGDLSDEDFFDEAIIEASADQPISRGTFQFWRAAGAKSLAPLMEGSTLNRDSGDTYAPMLNPVRRITVEVATMLPGQTPESGDWMLIWDGLTDEIDWATERITVHARDRMAQLNDTIIETVTAYGDDDGSENIDDVMQEILDDVFGVGVWPMTVVGTPTLPMAEKQIGNVSVLDALTAYADLIGWSLHYRWDASESEFRLTFYEPDRDNVTPSYTFGPDDYYTVSRAAIGVEGIRNKGEVVYTDVSGVQQTVADTRDVSEGIYGTRFIRLDSQDTSIVTEAQANALLAAVLDDLEDPKAVQELDAALHWPIEIGDVHSYLANDVHYDTTQTFACFGYTHTITPDRLRTTIQAAGKPSGGFRRWHRAERTERGAAALDLSARIRLEPVPGVLAGTRGFYFDLHYDLGADVTRVAMQRSHSSFTGFVLFSNIALSGRGVYRILNQGDSSSLFLASSADPVEVGVIGTTVTNVSLPEGAPRGEQVYVRSGPLNEVGYGTKAQATSGGAVLLGDYLVAGDGITIDTDANGRPRIRLT